jgi:hypothetical protein
MATLKVSRTLWSDEQKAAFERAALALPDDWTVTAVSNVTAPFLFDVRIEGPGVLASRAFSPTRSEDAVRFLEGIARALAERERGDRERS